MKDVGVCIPFFAAGPSPRRNENLRKTLDELGSCDAKQVLIVDCDMGHVCTADLGSISHIVPGDVLWQKERLMQIGCEMLIKRGYKKIVCMDGDCLIRRKGWLQRASMLLKVNKAIQCFGRLRSIGDERTLVGTGAVAAWKRDGKLKRVTSGGVWGYHADIIKKPGLYQRCIVGSGDAVHYAGMFDPQSMVETYRDWGYSLEMQQNLMLWAKRWQKAVAKRIDYVQCTAIFQSHGRRDGRGCGTRHLLLRDYNPSKDVKVVAGEGLRWSRKKPSLHRRVAEYIRHRAS